MPVLHVPLKSWASSFRIKATPVDRFIGCVCLKKDFVPEGKGTLCQRGSPKVMGVGYPLSKRGLWDSEQHEPFLS